MMATRFSHWRSAALSCGLALTLFGLPAAADWMLISKSGSKPNRSALYVDLDSLREVPTESGWRTLLDVPPGAEREKLFRRPLGQELEAVEVLESPAGPESRDLLFTIEPEGKLYRVARGRVWGRDGSCAPIGASPWKPVEPGQTTSLLKFSTEQKPWREALLALLQRTQREKNVSEQTELAPFGYEYVQGGDAAGLGEITRKYVWTDSDPASLAGTLEAARRQRGPLRSEALPSTARLEGLASYFNDSRLEDRGTILAPPGTVVYAYPISPEVSLALAVKDRVGVFSLGGMAAEISSTALKTQVHDSQGHFVFEGLKPGLYAVEVQIPYRFILLTPYREKVYEERTVYVDGSYDVDHVEEATGYDSSWQNAPGNWTLDVVEVLPGDAPTRMLLSNVRTAR